MSQENLEIVRACYECFARREFPEQYLAEDFEWTTARDLPDAGTHRGIEAVRKYFVEWVGAWAEVRNEPVDWFDAGDAVVVFVHGEFRLTADSKPFESDYAHLWRLANGQVRSVQSMGRADALEALGLGE